MKMLNEEDLEKVTGGIAQGGLNQYRCKVCSTDKIGQHYRANYKYICGNGDIISRTVDVCKECYETVKENEAYSNWRIYGSDAQAAI